MRFCSSCWLWLLNPATDLLSPLFSQSHILTCNRRHITQSYCPIAPTFLFTLRFPVPTQSNHNIRWRAVYLYYLYYLYYLSLRKMTAKLLNLLEMFEIMIQFTIKILLMFLMYVLSEYSHRTWLPSVAEWCTCHQQMWGKSPIRASRHKSTTTRRNPPLSG